MKILFINPSLRPDSKRRQLPVGLAYIMTAVKKAGFDFDFVDMDINHLTMEDLEDTLSQKCYDVCAFGCMVTGFKFVIQIADIVKKINPESVIIAGNTVAHSIPEILLNTTKVDIGVMGEGDITIVELLHAIEQKKALSSVKGIFFRGDGKIIHTLSQPAISKIDDIGFPDWRLFDLNKYNEYGTLNVNSLSSDEIISFPLNAARGCPHNCTFCYHAFKGSGYRKYSVEMIIEEIKRLHYEYGCNYISFWDELTFSNIKSVENVVGKISALDFKIQWEASCRGDLFKAEHLGLITAMKDSGCVNMSFSLENASAEILAAMNKKLTVSQFIGQAKTLWTGGVVPLTSVIFGYPQETPATIRETIKVCEECNIFPSVGFLLPLPGTPIYQWAIDNGRIVNEVAYLEKVNDRQDFHINLTNMTDNELIDNVTRELECLAEKQGLKFESVFKTVTYQKPKTKFISQENAFNE